jgi:hypothetical protein
MRRSHPAEAANAGSSQKMSGEQEMNGLEGMLEFLTLLRRKKISYRIEQQRDDALMVTLTLIGVRVEVEFFSDHFEYSYFTGSEAVHSDREGLMRLIAENWE